MKRINIIISFIIVSIFLTSCSQQQIEEWITFKNPEVIVNPKGGVHNNPVTISFSSKTKGLTYYYTLDGKDPTTNSKKYTSPFVITTNCVLKVRGYIEEEAITKIKREEYKFKVGGFNVSPATGEFTADQISVSISPITEGATVIYTTDGSTPSRTNGNIYTEAIPLNQFTVIKVFAYKTGYEDSDVYRYAYSFKTLDPQIEPLEEQLTFPTLIKLSNQTPNSLIYYTLDGSWPSSNSSLYTNAGIILTPQNGNETITLKTIAYRYGFSYSSVISKTYFFKIENIGIIPEPEGKIFSSSQQVELFCPVVDAQIYYTLDDSTPDNTKTPYSGPITINTDKTLKAIAIRDGMKSSEILVKRFVFNKVHTPYSSHCPGVYNAPIGVTISCATSGAEIRYTLNGTEPNSGSTLYTGTPITISTDTILKIKAFKAGLTDSDTYTANYVIKAGYTKVSDPTGDTPSGSYNEIKLVNITCPTSGARIYWAIDSTPDINSEQYFNEVGEIEIFKTCNLRLIAYKEGMACSNLVSLNYTIGGYKVSAPEISIPSGEYKDIQIIEISHPDPEVIIRYTLDNSEPTNTSKIYNGSFVLNGISPNITLKAKAFKQNCTESDTVSANYSFKLSDVFFNPIGGEYGY